jgi:Pvc16 N-terminal domain
VGEGVTLPLTWKEIPSQNTLISKPIETPMIIRDALEQIRDKLNEYFRSINGVDGKAVIKDVARIEQASGEVGGEDTINKVFITLANIEEENTLKNNYPLREQGSVFISDKPALFLNLYILLSAHFEKYEEESLKYIGYTLGFFQSHQTLKFKLKEQSGFCTLTFNLHNISLENLNNLWVVMGGKYMPSVLYKVKLIMIQESMGDGARAVLEINSNENLS